MALNKYDKQHLRNLTAYERQVDAIYRAADKEAAALGLSIRDLDPTRLFSFSDYPITRKRFESLLESLKSGLSAVIVNGVNHEWTLANNKNNELCRQVFGDNVGSSQTPNIADTSRIMKKPVTHFSPARFRA